MTERYYFTFLRHGESVGNAEGLHQGQSDFPLTLKGQEQASALAERWVTARVCFDLIISSPLPRARQTAEIIAEALDVPLEFDPIWMERSNGRLAGMRPEEAAQLFPRPGFINPYQAIGETGESQWEVYLRAGKAVQSLLRRPLGRYLIVSHGVFLNMTFYAILGIIPQANYQGPHFRFRNISFAEVTYNPVDHYWRVEKLNDREHWKEGG